ncbi:MAG: carboxypeptidase M32, partial [Marinovum sp.]|nr:carboxypeptidase M32 [Marinovum sp.]
MTAFSKLMEYQHQTEALVKIATRLGWDQETVMPKGALQDRAEESAALEKTLHDRRSSSELEDLLAAAQSQALTALEKRQVSLIERALLRARKVPVELSVALARITPKSHQIWAKAREDDDFMAFAPILEEVIQLRRQEGEALAQGGNSVPYEALLK